MTRSLPAKLLAFTIVGLFGVAGTLALRATPAPSAVTKRPQGAAPAPLVVEEAVPPHREPPPPPPPSPSPPPPPPPSPAPSARAKPKPAPKPKPPPAVDAGVYEGLGAWVDLYDYVLQDRMDPLEAVDEMARRGVGTLYLQTNRWSLGGDIYDPATVSAFVERAHAREIKVVGWYLPGFADLDRDIRRSLAVLEFVTPAGHRFDGFAADIEDRREVDQDLTRFIDGIAEYSTRLRLLTEGKVVAAIVPDAKNNERAPHRWVGFPWSEIARHYDVVMPMAYWSVSKGRARCGTEYDVEEYLREVVSKTVHLMGRSKPLHPIGGIADCIGASEVAGYVRAVKELGSLGGSLYDFATTQANPARDELWAELRGLNA